MRSVTAPCKDKKRKSGILRAFGLAAVFEVSALAIGVPAARAREAGKVEAASTLLLNSLGPALLGPPQAAVLNGQHMMLASKATTLSVTEVLRRFESHCQERWGSASRELAALPEAIRSQVPKALLRGKPWWTQHQKDPSDQRGQVACLVPSADDDGSNLLERIARFAWSGDVSRLGDPLYVVAKRESRADITHVLTLWTEGPFLLRAMFPDTGDVPGGDSEFVPRPVDSVRILSARMQDRPYALYMYETPDESSSVLAFYEREMHRREFVAVEGAGMEQSAVARAARAFSKQGAGIVIAAVPTETGHSRVSIVEMGSQGYRDVTVEEAP